MAKGEMSLNVIVMAALAIIVLLVLTFIFIRGANSGSDGILSCASKQGTCVSGSGDEAVKNPQTLCNAKNQSYASWTCPKVAKDSVNVCCVKKGEIFGIKLTNDE